MPVKKKASATSIPVATSKVAATAAVTSVPPLPPLHLIIDAIALESVVLSYSVLQDFFESYVAFKNGKNQDLYHKPSANTAAGASAAVDSKTAKKEVVSELDEADSKEADEIIEKMTKLQLERKGRETVDRKVLLPNGEWRHFQSPKQVEGMDSKQAQIDLKVDEDMSEGLCQLSVIADQMKERKTRRKIANVNRGGKMEWFTFDIGTELKIPNKRHPNEHVKRAAKEMGTKSSYRPGMTFSSEAVPVSFRCVERIAVGEPEQPFQVEIPAGFPVNIGKPLKENSVDGAELGFTVSKTLTWLVCRHIGLLVEHERESHVRNHYLFALGSMLFERDPTGHPGVFLRGTVIPRIIDAFETCSTIVQTRSRCSACMLLKNNNCTKCGNPYLFEHKYGADDVSRVHVASRVETIRNLSTRVFQMRPTLQTTDPTYWSFLMRLWAPQLTAYSSSEGFQLGRYHRWSFDRLVDFLFPFTKKYGVPARLEMLFQRNIQIVHFDHLMATHKCKQFVDSVRSGMQQFCVKKYDETRDCYRTLYPPESVFNVGLHGNQTLVVGDVVFAYLFMPAEKRFVSMDELFKEAEETHSALHLIAPSVPMKGDGKFDPNAPEITAKRKEFNSRITSVQHKAAEERGIIVETTSKGTSVRAADSKNKVMMHKDFEPQMSFDVKNEDDSKSKKMNDG